MAEEIKKDNQEKLETTQTEYHSVVAGKVTFPLVVVVMILLKLTVVVTFLAREPPLRDPTPPTARRC